MDAVTYPHPEVKEELFAWIRFRSDVSEDNELAKRLGVFAVPQAIMLDAGGQVLGQMIGFVEPREFKERLLACRTTP